MQEIFFEIESFLQEIQGTQFLWPLYETYGTALDKKAAPYSQQAKYKTSDMKLMVLKG